MRILTNAPRRTRTLVRRLFLTGHLLNPRFTKFDKPVSLKIISPKLSGKPGWLLALEYNGDMICFPPACEKRDDAREAGQTRFGCPASELRDRTRKAA